MAGFVQFGCFLEEEDSPVWMYHHSGYYSVKSFYAVVNNGGIVTIRRHAIWKLEVPPRIDTSQTYL
jgi:hypothetical protein